MTQHVRTSYRRHPRAAWMLVSGILLLAALALAVVIPAFGAVGDPIPPSAKPSGAVPILTNVGGSNFSCTTNVDGMTGLSTFQVSNPPSSQTSVTYDSTNSPLPAGVTFKLTGINGQDKGKVFAFRATGVTVFYVGVKGGSDTARYKYAPAGVTADGATLASGVPSGSLTANPPTSTGLHSTKSPSGFNVASIATFCYARTTTISGKVFLDNDGDGSFGTSNTPPDAGLGGWSVALFRTSAPAGQVGDPIPSASSGDVGSYTFTSVPIGASYKVCVTPPSGTWSQSLPGAAETTTCSAPALGKGQPVPSLSGPATGVDFGNESAVVPSCGSTFSAPLVSGSGIVDYTAQLTEPPGTDPPGCKEGLLVMYSYLDLNNSPWAAIHPPAAGTDTRDFWVVERLRWKVDVNGAQNPVTLRYDDVAPYGNTTGPDPLKPMKMCTSDPRNSGSEFGLKTTAASSMPPGETTCEIQSTDFPSANPYNYEAHLFSVVDGLKGR